MKLQIDGRDARGTLRFDGTRITLKAPGFESGSVDILVPPPSRRSVQAATLDSEGAATVEVPEGAQYCVKVQKGAKCDVALLSPGLDNPRPLAFGDAYAVATCGACPQPAAALSTTVGELRVSALALGGETSCALLAEGTVRCWGENAMGMLGDGSGMTQPVPVRVEGLRDVQEIGVGSRHACARKRDGSVWCWGDNSRGQLGHGTSKGHESVPGQVSGLVATSLSVGSFHNCAISKDGQVLCWGWNDYRQLGVGDRDIRSTPTIVNGLPNPEEVRAGHFHTCARLQRAGLRCWGWNSHGQIGDGSEGESVFRDTPVEVKAVRGATNMILGVHHTCALVGKGELMCWGQGTGGPNQPGKIRNSSLPFQVQGLSDIGKVAAGFQTCVAPKSGGAQCWNVGAGPLTPVGGVQGPIADIVVGEGHACALLSDGSVRCWGRGARGQLGDGLCKERYGAAAGKSVQVLF
ncbi:hypothetical protein [Pendulispora albinea]|uniref:RCC1-like domain-containing protein n=1 Tax=Pendulispora albinea TaxID=2741071 RepID=A0ABZ2LVM5_9BACT